jgi:hypothetical protein
LDYW